MKLKTQENIRKTEIYAWYIIGIIAGILERYGNVEQINEIKQLLTSSNIDLEKISDIIYNIWYIDFLTSFRTQKLTEEYRF